MRYMDLYTLLALYKDGDERGWSDEFADLWTRDWPAMYDLCDSVNQYGVRNPILLGNDGRVWDGHHRLAAATNMGLVTVPVEFA